MEKSHEEWQLIHDQKRFNRERRRKDEVTLGKQERLQSKECNESCLKALFKEMATP